MLRKIDTRETALKLTVTLPSNATLALQREDGRSLGTDCSLDYTKPIGSFLFNITADPTESTNLVDQFPHHVSHFTKQLVNYDIYTTAYQVASTMCLFGRSMQYTPIQSHISSTHSPTPFCSCSEQ